MSEWAYYLNNYKIGFFQIVAIRKQQVAFNSYYSLSSKFQGDFTHPGYDGGIPKFATCKFYFKRDIYYAKRTLKDRELDLVKVETGKAACLSITI